jgi:pantothenate kinase-related protein Tda10
VKTYLDVPFSEKEKVKALGGRYDMSQWRWFVPDGVDLALFVRWLPGAKPSKTVRKLLGVPRL